ncbi:hypothetical protein BDV3_005470 [Batrachochytrium dendrobatidis]
MLLLSLLSSIWIAAPLVLADALPQSAISGPCIADEDCAVYNKRLAGWAPGPQPGGYLCVNAMCKYVVAAGELCSRSSDCSVYEYIRRTVARNASASLLPTGSVANMTGYMNSICSPSYCTIASTCSRISDPLFNYDPTFGIINLPDQHVGNSCCGGATDHDACSQLGSFLDICSIDHTCSASPDPTIDHLTCAPVSERSTQWIGVIITLVGAATLNIGLNLQKLALRKRQEKFVKKKEQQRSNVVRKITSFRVGLSDLYRKYSFASLPFGRRTPSESPPPASTQTDELSTINMPESTFNSNSRSPNPTTTGDLRPNPGETNLLLDGLPTSKAHTTDSFARPTTNVSQTQDFSKSREHLNTFEASSTNAPIVALDSSHLTLTQSENKVAHTDYDRTGFPETSEYSTVLNQQADQDEIVSQDALKPKSGAENTKLANGKYPAPVPRAKSTNDHRAHRLSMGNTPEFEKKLNFSSLLRSPAWMLGMLVFIIGNFLNFIALQFAAQSLVAPLGSISLVVNVIIAPLLNNEKWTYKDVVGVILIVGGSSMVVAFAGVSGKDYNLCVLMALFRRVPTIAFLVVTSTLIAVVFCTIVIVEKNLDIVDEPTAATIKETLAGRLIKVETNGDGNDEDRPSDESDAQVPVIADNINGLTVSVRERMTSDGETRRTLTLAEAPSPLKSGFGEELQNGDASRFIPKENTVGNLLNAKNSDGRSVYSVCLTFVVDDANKQKTTQSNTPSLSTSAPNASASFLPVVPKTSSIGGFENVSQTAKVDTRSSSLDCSNDIHEAVCASSQDQADDTIHHLGQIATVPGRPTPFGISSRHSHDTQIEHHPMMPPISLSREPTSTSTVKSFKPHRLKCLQSIRNAFNQLPFIIFLKNIKLVPRLKHKISLSSIAVRVILPFSYASLGGLMATITVLFAKATVHLLSATFFEGNNQFNNFGSWLITGVTVVTAVSQIYWINMGLQRYDALLQIPVFYVVWTLFDVVGGGIYFDEFRGFNTKQYALFIFSVCVIFAGVSVLASRLKSLSDEEILLNGGVVPEVGKVEQKNDEERGGNPLMSRMNDESVSTTNGKP